MSNYLHTAKSLGNFLKSIKKITKNNLSSSQNSGKFLDGITKAYRTSCNAGKAAARTFNSIIGDMRSVILQSLQGLRACIIIESFNLGKMSLDTTQRSMEIFPYNRKLF